MKPLVIYHDNCADGFGAAFAAWLKFGDEAEYKAAQYGKSIIFEDEFLKARDVYIFDFSFSKEVMDTLFSVAKRVVWLDHHKSAFEMWCGTYYPGKAYKSPLVVTASGQADWPSNREIVLDDRKSGALLAWQYFHPGKEVPMLIRHIDDHDRWQFKLEGTREFIKALWSYAPWSFELFHSFVEQESQPNWLTRRYNEGAAILRAHEHNVQAVVKGATRKCNIWSSLAARDGKHEWVGLAANCPPHLASDVGHTLATQSGTYGLLWYINIDGKCLCSLRSNGDYDVSTLAKAFGGGGHKNAAGFEVQIDTLLGWLEQVSGVGSSRGRAGVA